MKILIVRVSSLGDVVHTLPAAALIQQLIPSAEIHWVVQKKAADLLRIHGSLKQVWELPDHYLHPQHWRQTWQTITQLRRHRWDAIIDFQGLLKTTALTLFLSGRKFGFNQAHARSALTAFFNHDTTSVDYRNIIQKNLALASFACYNLVAHQQSPTTNALSSPSALHYPENVIHETTTWLTQNAIKKYILISPNTTWESKHWPLEYWQFFLQLITNHEKIFTRELSIILVGSLFGQQGAELAIFIKSNNLPIHLLPPWSLTHVAYVITQADLIIAPDTGLLHLADFLGTRTLGIFGPTLALRHGPFLQDRNAQQTVQIKCPHLYKKTHGKNTESMKTTNCMYTLTPEELVTRVTTLLSR